MALTTAQRQALRAALEAEQDAGVVAALLIRNDVALTDWCNSPSPTKAWLAAARKVHLFEAMDLTKFDVLSAGKRDSWRLMIDMANDAPLDLGKGKARKAVSDVWGSTADGQAVLTGLTEFATRAEAYLGGTLRTEATVSALGRVFVGTLSLTEVSQTLNGAPAERNGG